MENPNSETVQLCGTVEAVNFQNPDNGFTVLLLCTDDGEMHTVVGTFAGVAPGEALALHGRFVQHKAYGPQFEASDCQYELPSGKEGVEKYLASGVLPGIGPALATRIVARFGEQSLEMLAREPEKLAEVRGMTPQKAREAGARFMELFGIREAVTTLARLGLEATEAIAMYRAFGETALDAVLQNPYRLCGWPVYLNFMRADAIAAALSEEPDARLRARAALLYTLRHNMQNGHTCLPRQKLLDTTSGFFRIQPEIAQQELAAVCELGDAALVQYSEREWVYLDAPYRAERACALRLRMIAAQPCEAPPGVEAQIERREAAAGMQYAPQQRRAILEVMNHGAMVITGGPGTGKTTTVNAIIDLFEKQAERVLLTAPTGRAAKRMAELTGRKASTIHRLLEVDFSEGQELPRFKRNDKNPLRCDVLIVDEMSMVDVFLFESLLCALRPGCRLVMVGDADQLPSVGPGNVLRAILDSGAVPAVTLHEIFRQAAASLIVKNAHRIVLGQVPESGAKTDDFFFLRAYGAEAQELVLSLMGRRLPKSYGFLPVQDIQVLCPGRKGPLGTEALNERLQEMLNPPADDKPELRLFGTVFRLGDKVMQVQNDYDIPFVRTNGEVGAGAFNGEIGIVERVGKGAMTVLMEDRRLEYSSENMHKLELAYAVTIHKSQGSEFEAVVIPLAEVPKKLRYRNLLYTGVTRAKRLCVLVGEDEVLAQMVQAANKNRRYSCMKDFLQDGSDD